MGFVLLLCIAVGLYVCFLAALPVLARPRPPADPPAGSDAALPDLAILVPARDEEAALPRCIAALLAQAYPAGRLRLILADDHSTDRTAALIADCARAHPHVSGLRVAEGTDGLIGKANALHQAIMASSSPILLTTDADCTPPPEWARNLALAFTDPTLGMVCGITVAEGETLFDDVQLLDWLLLMVLAACFSEAGIPVTAMGNNMAFRREAYQAVGGYPKLPFSVTEDYALFRAIHAHPDWSVCLRLEASLRNRTTPLRSVRDVFRQRKRWARGGLRSDPWIYGLYTVLFLAHALLLAGLFITPVLAGGLLILKTVADALLIRFGARRLRVRVPWRAFAAFEAYLFGYMLLLPFALVLAPKTHWKGRRY